MEYKKLYDPGEVAELIEWFRQRLDRLPQSRTDSTAPGKRAKCGRPQPKKGGKPCPRDGNVLILHR